MPNDAITEIMQLGSGSTSDVLVGPFLIGDDKVNQLALIESTYLFVELSRLIWEHAKPIPHIVLYRLELRNMTDEGKLSRLTPGPLTPWSSRSQEASDPSVRLDLKWQQTPIDPGIVSFQIVSSLYEWFGFEHDQVPYTAVKEEGRAVDPEQIKAIK